MGLFGKSTPSTVVGLDIGSELIKVSEAKLAKDGIRITGLGVAQTPVGTVDNNVIVDPKGLGAAIKQLLKESGIKAKHVVSSVAGQSSVVVRVIEVPKMSKDELAETMKWEVERHVPFSPTEIIMDFAPVDKPSTPPDAQSMEVLLAVAQQDSINAHVETLLAAGLMPVAIDVQPLAVSRPLVNAATNGVAQTVAVVDIGANTTEVEIFEDGLLVFPGPPLPIAGVNLTRAISEALGVSFEEAEMMKKESAAADFGAAQPVVDDAAFDIGGTADTQVSEPTAYDTAFQQPVASPFQQADSDFSPFDFTAAPPPPPAAQPEQQPDVSADDVFDLGGGTDQTQGFKPVFDLDDSDVQPQAAAPAAPTTPSVFDLDMGDQPAAPVVDDSPFAQDPAPVDYGTDPVDPVQQVPAYDTNSMINQAIAPVLIELATEIRRSIDYYTSRYQNMPEQVFLCGGTAKMRDLDVFLSNELGIPVHVGNPMAHFNVNLPKYSPQYLSEVAPLFPVSIGLAVRDMIK